jgi:hypothetical protein
LQTMELSKEQRAFLALWEQHGPSEIAAPVPEYRFARRAFGRQWRADLCFVPQRVIIEFDGGAWSRRGGKKCPCCGQTPTGRHNTGAGFLKDLHKLDAAAALGYIVLRYPPHEFMGREAGIILNEVASIVSTREAKRLALARLDSLIDQVRDAADLDDWQAVAAEAMKVLSDPILDRGDSWRTVNRWITSSRRRRPRRRKG